jgi:imidazolonepropionase-like amidohydrolase
MSLSGHSRRRAGFRLALLLLCASAQLPAQIDNAPIEGLRENTPRIHALTGARIHVAPGVEIESATIVLRDGLVTAVGADVDSPAGARVWDVTGRIVYPGFIDPMSEFGLPDGLRTPRPRGPDAGPPPQPPEPAANGFWNSRIRPEIDVATLLELDDEATESLRAAGLTTVLSVPRRGILRGASAALNLGASDQPRDAVLATRVAQHAGAEMAGSDDEYPSSLMGVIALLRQAFYDAEWYRVMQDFYADNPEVERAADNVALGALLPVVDAGQRLVYAADDELDYDRALAIAAEFGLDLALYGNGHEYRRLERLAGLAHPLIVPLDFPEAPDVSTPDGALDVSLETLQHWELAPSNAAFLAGAGIEFAFTADGLDDVADDLWRHVRLAIERGLPAETAFAALTTVPAELLGLSARLGTLEAGKIANLVVADADLFTDDDAAIELVFVDGEPFPLDAWDAVEPEGRWQISWATGTGEWTIGASGNRLTLAIDGEDYRAQLDGEQVLLFPDASVLGGGAGLARLTGYLTDDTIDGLAELPDGTSFAWYGRYLGEADDAETAGSDDDGNGADVYGNIPPLVPPAYPAGAYGLAARPEQAEVLLVRGATIWTSAAAGVLESADLLVREGRIAAVGADLDAPRGAVVIDANGKHVTAGLVDAHSHTAISRGINEGTSAVTVEVRIEDVLDPTDINIYRQLAGGLTTANVMHGSANPMGGQARTIKLRWGEDAEGLEYDDAPPGVKFALGENVKQSNWGDEYTTRYPQTRMGVDEIIRDTFDAAAAYGQARANRGRSDPPVRRNLRLDAALEILSAERSVHVHSYRQDEILAFVRLAQEYSLDVAAFQHVLEGYKVGPEIAALGAGGSTFSDWWGYKYEVIDAIPYNGALMHEAGVVVSFNSDDDELATRLYTEAAKAVKYGGVPEEAALDFVTINPAIQLGVDDRVGSLEPGKDADFVIWSGHPLSTFTRAEQTWIEGRRYFDIEADAAVRTGIAAERSRLIQKVLDEQFGDSGPPKEGDENDDEAEADESEPGADFVSDLYSSISRRTQAKEGDNE